MRLPLAVIIVAFAVSLLTDLYIWIDIRECRSRKRWGWSNFYAASSVALWIFLAVTVCLPRRGLDGGVYVVMWMLTSYLSIYASKLIYCIFSLLGRIPTLWHAQRWRWTRYFGLILCLGGFGSIWYGILFVRNHIQTVRISLASGKLPSSFEGYKIVQISDLHLGTWGSDAGFITELVDSINELNPDVIVFTGDLVNQKADEVRPFTGVLSRLRAKDGVYSIPGNHDYGDYVDWPSAKEKEANMQRLKALQAQCGWKMLNNAHVFIHRRNGSESDSIALIGVENWGEPPFGQYGDLNKAYPSNGNDGVNDNHFKILLTHNPEHWVREVRKNSNIDLSLSGHTHAMQMSVNAFGRRWSPSALRYSTWGGFYTENDLGEIEDFGNPTAADGLTRKLAHPSLYVNIGAGEVAMPYRLGSSYPEITLITLKGNNGEGHHHQGN